jgi:hypothetical protein
MSLSFDQKLLLLLRRHDAGVVVGVSAILGHCYTRARRLLLALFLAVAALLPPALPSAAQSIAASAAPTANAGPAAPAWLEPRGLSVIDLVGLVPEAHLVNTIVSSRVGTGILQYISGKREGDTVTVTVRIHPRYWTDGTNNATTFGCLGKPAIADEWPIAMPPSQMRLFEAGKEITAEILVSPMDYVPAGQIWPDNGGSDWWRYDFRWGQRTVFAEDGSVSVPANMGCVYNLTGRRTNLTATFVVTTPNYLTVAVQGQEDFIFHAYIGAGNAGHMAKLNEQMNRRHGNRHDKFDLTIPDGTDYVLVKYPPTPVDPYMGQPEINVFLPSSGTYRINGGDNTLSVDHVSSMAMPLFGQWQDADQSGGDYLRFFSNPRRLASPEYFVPTGVAYDPCMVNGGCSEALLDRIYGAEMTMTIYYYRIARVRDGLTRIPLKQVGPDWQPAANVAAAAQAARPGAKLDDTLYLPVVFATEPKPVELPDGDAAGCPCGWFDGYGRMFDYIAAP